MTRSLSNLRCAALAAILLWPSIGHAAQTGSSVEQAPRAPRAATPPPAPLPPAPRAVSGEGPGIIGIDQQRAEEVRRQLRRVLELYPPALARVLKLDPSLMANPSYMAPYPAVTAFLQQHPEIARDTDYFLNFVDGGSNWQEPRDREAELRQSALRAWQDVIMGTLVFMGVVSFMYILTGLIKSFVAHRRWLRATKMQADVNNRVLERLASNDEFMSYMQSPAGSQLLKVAPIATDLGTPALGAPFSRILWSIQLGLVLVSGGAGLLVIRHYVTAEVGDMMLAIGVLGISIGVGFGLAAAASYVLSNRLGLIQTRDAPAERGLGV